MVADPVVTPVTRPLADTVATAGVPDVNVIGRPLSTLPCSSVTCAVSCSVWPTTTLACPGDNTTAPTGFGLTVIAAVPDFPSLVAEMVALPAAIAVTRPVEDTLATLGALVDHTTVRP